MSIFVIADTHFNHLNIIKYCNRPFNNVDEMNEKMINNWNRVITDDDDIYHLGDFGFGSFDELKTIFDRLNGKKYLLLGNHDAKRGKTFFLNMGFINVFKKEIIIYETLLSHYPINDILYNVFGHIHNAKLSNMFDKDSHYCVSVEMIDYTPMKLDDVKRKIRRNK